MGCDAGWLTGWRHRGLPRQTPATAQGMGDSAPATSDPTPTHSSDDTVHVQIVLDRSGSMCSPAASTIDSFSGFLAKQHPHPGSLRMSLAEFDSRESFRNVIDASPDPIAAL